MTNRVVASSAPLAVGCLDGLEVGGVPLGDCHGDPKRRPGRGRDGPPRAAQDNPEARPASTNSTLTGIIAYRLRQ